MSEDVSREQQAEALARRLKIPRPEADRLLTNMTAGGEAGE